MDTIQNQPAANALSVGEYGATKVVATKDGSMVRLAFGREGSHGPVFYLAVLLSPEAVASLKGQLDTLGL
jgi:hypothetical protein